MADFDKVIHGLRKCLSKKSCSKTHCPYEAECGTEHVNAPLLRDSMDLIQEQRTRIKTLEALLRVAEKGR